MREAYIYDALRTPRGKGKKDGSLHQVRPIELVAGLLRDPQFGPVVMFGLGGIFAEALSDVSFAIAPLSVDDAHRMLSAIAATKLLGPFRGEAAVDHDALAAILTGLSDLASDRPDIAEVDINPLVTGPDGSVPHYGVTVMASARVRGLISFEPHYLSFGLVRPGQVVSRTTRTSEGRSPS